MESVEYRGRCGYTLVTNSPPVTSALGSLIRHQGSERVMGTRNTLWGCRTFGQPYRSYFERCESVALCRPAHPALRVALRLGFPFTPWSFAAARRMAAR